MKVSGISAGVKDAKAENYSYAVTWSEEDKAFVGKVLEFPSVSAHGDSQENALREVRNVVELVLEDLVETGEPIPLPFGRRRYSGKLNIRMPEDLHRRLAIEAQRHGISLNTLINLKLSK